VERLLRRPFTHSEVEPVACDFLPVSKITRRQRPGGTLTGLGQEALAAELQRYREVVALAKRKHLSPSTFAYGV
jgi:hypothetical protein